MGAVPELKVHRSVFKALKLFDADRLRWLDEAAALGPVVVLRMGPVRVWVVSDPEVARSMLVTDSGSWMRPPATVVPIRMGVGENLFSQPEKDWAELQPWVAPAFRKKALEPRLADLDAIIGDEVTSIPNTATDSVVDLELAMGRIALRAAAWVLLGERLVGAQAEEIARHQREVVRWVGMRLGQFTGFLPIAAGADAREMKRHRAVLDAYADDVIVALGPETTEVMRVTTCSARCSPPDLRGRPLSPGQLRSHVLGLFLAGNETTAAALSWAVVHGAHHPDEWAKVRLDPVEREPASGRGPT